MVDIGIIGGSGFYEFFEHMEEVSIDTHYGKASDKIAIGTFEGKKIAFIPRHGKQHQYAPHNIPYKANLAALKELGVKWIIAPTACGSLNEKMKIGDFVITDQYINFTHKRDNTLRIEGVEHISMAQPYCEALRELAIKVGNEMGITVHKQGTMIVIEGPMFSTKAESRFYKLIGGDTINMTQYPECYLARELGMCYLNISVITDYDAGLEGNPNIKPVSYQQVQESFAHSIDTLKMYIKLILRQLDTTQINCCNK